MENLLACRRLNITISLTRARLSPGETGVKMAACVGRADGLPMGYRMPRVPRLIDEPSKDSIYPPEGGRQLWQPDLNRSARP